jgi:3-methyladenine DNA glycosylase AlkD
MMACLAAHDKSAKDTAFLKCLPMIEKAASDDGNFVKKGVSWGLRGIGHEDVGLIIGEEDPGRRAFVSSRQRSSRP